MRNVEIEEGIRRTPENLDGYEVYADWLLEHGEAAHGEAILFAVRRLRSGAVDPMSILMAEARLLQDRRRILGPLGDLPRGAVECELHLGFLRALRIYNMRESAANALRHGLTHRAGAFLERVGVHRKSTMRLPHVNEDRATGGCVWDVIFEVKIPRWVRSVALPLSNDSVASQLDELAHVRECSFPLRNHRAVATEIHRLSALERLVFTTADRVAPLQLESLADCAPALVHVRQLHLAFDRPFEYERSALDELREALPFLTIGSHE